jgi:hypothetical protein
MTEPRGSARDSSRQDRKAPEICLLRTRQPRPSNVVRNGGQRHPALPRQEKSVTRGILPRVAAGR